MIMLFREKVTKAKTPLDSLQPHSWWQRDGAAKFGKQRIEVQFTASAEVLQVPKAPSLKLWCS